MIVTTKKNFHLFSSLLDKCCGSLQWDGSGYARLLFSLVAKTKKESETNQMQSVDCVVSMSQPSFPISFNIWATLVSKRLHERQSKSILAPRPKTTARLNDKSCAGPHPATTIMCIATPSQLVNFHTRTLSRLSRAWKIENVKKVPQKQ